jgi:mannose-1-phosphate guanylyltransferase
MNPDALHALVLAGGRGTRFWPLSRQERPKQLLPMVSEATLLEETLERLEPLVPRERTWVCTTADLEPRVRELLPELTSAGSDRILVEPDGRDTLPAIAWAVWQMRRQAELIAVLPSDHWIARPDEFRSALAVAARAAHREHKVMTLGVRPDRPETGFGYLEIASQGLENPPQHEESRTLEVRRFVEKPDSERAREFLAAGNFLWNAGMFVFPSATFLAELERLQPQLSTALPGLERAAASGDSSELARLYSELPRISIDFGLMERVEAIGAVPLDCGWSDLGSIEALGEILEPDSSGNSCRGEVITVDSRGNLLVSDSGTLVALGVEDLTVVITGDAVLVMPRDRAQDVRQVVEALRRAGRADLL